MKLIPIQVECYAGAKADETPRSFLWSERTIEVVEVLDHCTWLEHASKEPGSWWPHWLSWAQNRSGEKRPAPAKLGTAEIPPLGEAPGQYVMEK